MSQFFKPDELRCRCDRPDCDAVPMQFETMMIMDGVRREYGKPMHVNSAERCPYWNEKEGGSDTSDHLRGDALDIRVKNSTDRGVIMMIAIRHGFTAIGIPGGKFIHLGRRPGPLVVFGY
jgi:uncharacterized protein YcbK (DUF882 family)